MGLLKRLLNLDGITSATKYEIIDEHVRHLLTTAVEEANEAGWSLARMKVAMNEAHHDCVKADKLADLKVDLGGPFG